MSNLSDWQCRQCGETSSDDFDACWNCGHDRDGKPPAQGFDSAKAANQGIRPDAITPRQINCLRCRTSMQLVGIKRFHEGSNLAPFLMGDLGELFIHRENCEVHACPGCGKLEFFLVEPPSRDETPAFVPDAER